MFKDTIIVVTGATGSWGHELVGQLLSYGPKQIRLFSRNEFAQVNMKRRFHLHSNLKYVIGDIRDYHAVLDLCRDADYVFHLAAIKHVPICEEQPIEAVRTNVSGTENVIRASIAQGVKKVIDVSSDKAVDPINIYGMTKAIGERLIIQANEICSETSFVCIRGGNVLGTSGSVVPWFKTLIAEGQTIPITSMEMTRFFLSIRNAIKLLLTAALSSIGGETFVMRMMSCKIIELAEVLSESLTGKSAAYADIGIRPGEKIHEILISEHESPHTHEYNNDYFIILPAQPSPDLVERYSSLPKVSFRKYESSSYLMPKADIYTMLAQGGFLI